MGFDMFVQSMVTVKTLTDVFKGYEFGIFRDVDVI
jgi:hypothetical protein